MSTDYSKMSDQEINMAIAGVIFPDYKVIESKSRPPSACVISHLPSKWVDYCNNPADAWPIIFGNKLWLRELYGQWHVCGFPTSNPNNVVKYFHEKPLRAAMVLFLMMQEYKNAS